MRRPGRLVVVFGLVAALVHVGTAGASSRPAVPEGGLSVMAFATGNPDQAVWDYEITDITCFDGSVVSVAGVDATVTQTDGNTGTISFPVGTPGGSYLATFDCDDGKGVISGTLALTFAAVTVTKVVEGDAPAGATFPVTVACNTAAGGRVSTEFAEGASGVLLDTTISFPAAGGTRYLVAYTPQSCSIAELDDAGAASATIELADCGDGRTTNAAPTGEAAGPDGGFVIFEPTDCTQTITNVFADAAQPANVVQPQPAFTG